MLRIVQNTSAGGAKSYYSTADYYTEDQELQGQWRGVAAERLGLSGEVQRTDWDALCDNRDPNTGNKLTPRDKSNRRVGYDLNFHAPKSLSVLYSLTQDERLLDAFRESVDVTMNEMEREVKARIRKDGKNEDRTTGNLAWGEFIHFTARPVDGVPDPHLHAHCFAFNITFDGEENRWKAAQFADLKRDAPFFEAVFHSHLARRLEQLGLSTERTRKGWEIAGVPTTVVGKFSRRTALIEAKAKAMGLTDDRDKDGLGAKTRDHKVKDLPMDKLREAWRSRLSADETAALDSIRDRTGSKVIPEDDRITGEAVQRAIDHSFERSAVIPERKLLTEALKRSVGKASPERVIARVRADRLVSREREGRRWVTTHEVLAEEQRMLDFARKGRGTCRPLGSDKHIFADAKLNDGQRKAVMHILTSTDRVILIRGAAGTGKTTMMKEAVAGIERGHGSSPGKQVFTFAPSADASRGVLRSEGFENAETVARLLNDTTLQAEVQGQVLWIDEAGLLGSRTTAQLFDLAGKLDARVILSGDRRQHGSVERGSPLRLLETEAGLAAAEIKEIVRQRSQYKEAVRNLSDGRTDEGFRKLDQLGWVREIGDADRYRLLATDYIDTVTAGKTALVVSPTHLEGEWITGQIRSELKRLNRLGTDERTIITLQSANLTAAERADSVNHLPGDVVVFTQDSAGGGARKGRGGIRSTGAYRKGQRLIVGHDRVPSDQADRFQLYRPNALNIASGDLIRITQNGTTADGAHRLNNGAIYTVKGFKRNGNIVLNNGWIVAQDFGHLTHGYVVTSHASQGKTVDRVFIGQSSASFPASSPEQFYVSVSRGREQATIYTSDKESLMEAVSHSDERLTATELTTDRDHRERGITLHRMSQLTQSAQQASSPARTSRRELQRDQFQRCRQTPVELDR